VDVSSLLRRGWRAFSPDGKRIVTTSRDNTARVWDAETGHLLATLTGHINRVNNAAFSPDGKRIVTAGEDGTARVYIADLQDLLVWAKKHLPIESGK
jgi:WD40 repeat protein